VNLQQQGDRMVVRLSEWERADLELPAMSESDHVVASALAGGEGRLVVEELRDRTRLRATSWIGVVRIDALEGVVVPNYVGGNLGVVEMLDYINGFGSLVRYPRIRDLAVGGTSLFDLIALLLAEESRRLVRDGLLQDYVTREEPLPLMRGRLLPLEQVTRHYGQVDVLECRYDEFETDIDENRLLSAALEVVGPKCRDENVRKSVRVLRSIFQEVCVAGDLDWDWVMQPPEYHRRNQHYRIAHEYGRLILRALAVRDIFEASSTTSFTFLLDMNSLFERFVTRLLAEGLIDAGVRVVPQRRDRSTILEEPSGRPYRTVIPDVLLTGRSESTAFRVPLDAKYKLYEVGKIEPADIYQLFFYAYAFDRPPEGASRLARAFILYPSTDAWHQVRLRAQATDTISTARLVGLGVDVRQALEATKAGNVNSLPFLASIRTALVSPNQSAGGTPFSATP
jgi:5-methylcytosine-specific restriction enzyme subunit McrC